jgi:hypothetical protein
LLVIVNAADQAAAKAPKHQTQLGTIHKSPDKQTKLNANAQSSVEHSPGSRRSRSTVRRAK